MSDVQSAPISVTPDGRILKREEVVAYLKKLSEHILFMGRLEKEITETRAELAEATRGEESEVLSLPEPSPPIKDPYQLITKIATPVLSIAFLFMDYPLWQRILIFLVVWACFLISMGHHANENDKAQKEWEEKRAAYDREVERIQNLNSVVSSEDTSETAEIKKRLEAAETAYQKISASKRELENENILAPNYRKELIPCFLYSLFTQGRVNTLSEAINLFHTEIYQMEQRESQEQLREEMRMRQDAIMLQQELNMERISLQIENAKNEIEMQILLDSLYTTDMINRIWRELS